MQTMTLVIGSSEAQRIRETDKTLDAWYNCPNCGGTGRIGRLIRESTYNECGLVINEQWEEIACGFCGGRKKVTGWELYDRGWTVKMILQRVEITSPPG